MKPLYKVYEKKPREHHAKLVAAYHDFKKALAVSKSPHRYLLFKGQDIKSILPR